MSKVIYKYKVDVEITLPKGAEFLNAGTDGEGYLCLWYLVDLDMLPETKSLLICGTGRVIHTEEIKHLGTAMMPTGLVWHVFERLG